MAVSLFNVEFRIDLFAQIGAFDELFVPARLIDVAQEISGLPAMNADPDVLDVPSQEISGDVRAEQFRPNLVLAAVLGSLEDEELPVGAPDQGDFGTRPSWTFLRHSPGIEVLAKIQRDIGVVAQAAFSSATSPTGPGGEA